MTRPTQRSGPLLPAAFRPRPPQQPTPPPVTYLTVAEVATRLRVSKMTIYRAVHSGDLAATRVGARSFRIPERALEAFIAAGTWSIR